MVDFEKKKFCARQRLEWLLPISSTGSRPSFEVVTRRHQVRRAGVAARAAARTTVIACAHDLGKRACDLGQKERGRDIVLASRPRLEGLASRHPFGVATLQRLDWTVLGHGLKSTL